MSSNNSAKHALLDARAAGAQRFADKVCIVTGAGQGIGRATARRLAAEGGKIAIVERVSAVADDVASELLNHGVSVISLTSDVSVFAEAQALVKKVIQDWGKVDVLINTVGGTIWWQPYHLYTEEQIHLELERSIFTALWCCSAVLPSMTERRTGSIVNFSSVVVRGGLYRVPYAVSKGGVEALTRTLAAEYGRHGIRVNAVSPGSTLANDRLTSRLTLKPGKLAEPAPDADIYLQEARVVTDDLALRRSARSDEQAAVAAFLASDDASYVTGQIIQCIGDP